MFLLTAPRALVLYNIWWVIKQTGGCLHKQHVCNAIKKKRTKQKNPLMNNFKKCYWLPTTLDFCKVFQCPQRTPFWFWELIEIIITMVYYHHYNHITE